MIPVYRIAIDNHACKMERNSHNISFQSSRTDIVPRKTDSYRVPDRPPLRHRQYATLPAASKVNKQVRRQLWNENWSSQRPDKCPRGSYKSRVDINSHAKAITQPQSSRKNLLVERGVFSPSVLPTHEEMSLDTLHCSYSWNLGRYNYRLDQ